MDKTPFKEEDYWKFKWLQGAEFSPDGKQIVYAVTHYDEKSDADKQTIWMMDVASGKRRQMTAGTFNDSSPHFSPDGEKIGFISDRSGKPQIYTIAVDGGEAIPLTSIDQGVREGPIWSPDGKWIAFVSGLIEKDMPDFSKPYRLNRNIFRFNGIGMIHAALQQVYIIPAEGGEAKQLTQDDHINSTIRWSPDSLRILYGAGFPPDSFMQFMPKLRVVDLDGEVTSLLSDWGDIYTAEWVDDERIALIGSPEEREIGSKNDLFIYDIANDTVDNRSDHIHGTIGGGLQGDTPAMGLAMKTAMKRDGNTMLVPVQEGGTLHVCKFTIDGEIDSSAVITGERCNYLLDLSDDYVLYAVDDLNHPPELFLCDRNTHEETAITHLNDELIDSKLLPEVLNLKWQSHDGVEVEGWYLKPAIGEAPYPTILYNHGGPYGAFGNTYSCDFQLLAGAGYGVLAVNYRGSSGYGDEFGTGINGDWGNHDYQDLITGVDYVIDQGLADADRLGVCGLSAGGYHTCWMVGQTTRFKAAIPENPVSNLVSLYTLSDIGIWILHKAMGGSYYDIPETYVKSSPITYANRCTTPTLLIQGEEDFRCPAEQSEQFYTALKANGCIVEMLRLPGGSHVSAIAGPPPLRRAQNSAMLEWFNRYILGIEPEPEAETKEAEPEGA